jgi:hypothetical protein
MGRTPGTGTVFQKSDTDISRRSLFEAQASLLPGFAKPQEFVF